MTSRHGAARTGVGNKRVKRGHAIDSRCLSLGDACNWQLAQAGNCIPQAGSRAALRVLACTATSTGPSRAICMSALFADRITACTTPACLLASAAASNAGEGEHLLLTVLSGGGGARFPQSPTSSSHIQSTLMHAAASGSHMAAPCAGMEARDTWRLPRCTFSSCAATHDKSAPLPLQVGHLQSAIPAILGHARIRLISRQPHAKRILL